MYIVIEGNIGVGKTTLIKRMSDYIGWNYLDERVESDPEFQDLLNKYYKNNKTSIKLQTWLTDRRFNDIKNLSKSQNTLVERSIFGDIVFTRINCELGNITPEEYENYYKFAIECLNGIDLPKEIIYLRADPNICYKRTLHRNRECEEGITKDYIDVIHKGYESVMVELAAEMGIPVVTINYDEFKSVDEVVKECWLKTL